MITKTPPNPLKMKKMINVGKASAGSGEQPLAPSNSDSEQQNYEESDQTVTSPSAPREGEAIGAGWQSASSVSNGITDWSKDVEDDEKMKGIEEKKDEKDEDEIE